MFIVDGISACVARDQDVGVGGGMTSPLFSPGTAEKP